MYVLSGKGSVAGADLAACVLALCQQRGVLWDGDLPEYTLEFATQVPSVSRSIREGCADDVIDAFNTKLQHAEAVHKDYMLLCLTAHRLIPQLQTSMHCINLWDCAEPALNAVEGPIALLGTPESLAENDGRFLVLPDQAECIGDLITSIKRGYARLGENYAAHPRHLLTRIVSRFRAMGAKTFLLGCTDLHACRHDLAALNVAPGDIIDIVELAAAAIIDHAGRRYTTEFLDAASDARTHLRYKYVTQSDAPETDKKTHYLEDLMTTLPRSDASNIRILDIGGSSTGHSLQFARQLTDQPCHITLLEISAASLDAARPLYAAASGITTAFVNDALETFMPDAAYDAVLCLGVLLCISSDAAFVASVRKIADLMQPGATLLTRDCLTTEEHKIYMAFGGVIRSQAMYEQTFADAGLALTTSNQFVIEHPIRRSIFTAAWRKPN